MLNNTAHAQNQKITQYC